MNGLYHIFQEFLSNLDRPLNVPNDKITRWHPKFRLDEVPDIEPAEVPKPPNVQVYQTAKDVLENARGKVLPNVSMLTNIVNKFTSTKSVAASKHATHYSPRSYFQYYNLTTTPIESTYIIHHIGDVLGISVDGAHQCPLIYWKPPW